MAPKRKLRVNNTSAAVAGTPRRNTRGANNNSAAVSGTTRRITRGASNNSAAVSGTTTRITRSSARRRGSRIGCLIDNPEPRKRKKSKTSTKSVVTVAKEEPETEVPPSPTEEEQETEVPPSPAEEEQVTEVPPSPAEEEQVSEPENLVNSKSIIIEHCKQCNSFKTRAIQVKIGLEKGVEGVNVLVNPEKPRRGCFEIRKERGDIFVSLLDMKRPFKAMKDLDMEKVISDIVEKIR